MDARSSFRVNEFTGTERGYRMWKVRTIMTEEHLETLEERAEDLFLTGDF